LNLVPLTLVRDIERSALIFFGFQTSSGLRLPSRVKNALVKNAL
jgi:hypothetical protein